MDVYRYLVELERPDEGWGDVRRVADAARRAAADLHTTGVPVRFLRSVYVPEEDTCFFLFEGSSTDEVMRAVGASGAAIVSVGELVGTAVAPVTDDIDR